MSRLGGLAIDPGWLGELEKGVAAAVVFAAGYAVARRRWKRGEDVGGASESGVD